MKTDVVIIGGGLAGSLTAAMLGRMGVETVLVDPNPVYPPEFRCEKLDGPQVKTLELTGLADSVLRVATPDQECWIARFGRLVEKRPGDQLGIMYDTLVNTVRAQIPEHVTLVQSKVVDIQTSDEIQTVSLLDGRIISSRLIVLSNGLNPSLQQSLGIGRTIISPRHSLSIGFDIEAANGGALPFPALTYYAERPTDRIALLTLFPIGSTMRANLFAYRDARDPWLERLRAQPDAALHALWPNLRKITGDFTVKTPIKVRPVDLYVSTNYSRDGIVLVGDAFATSCPAAGTGARKAMIDVERLCNHHIARWLNGPGMQKEKIAQFYDDPEKQESDAFSQSKAFALRAFSINSAPQWAARRWAKFAMHWSKGLSRQLVGQRTSSPAAGVQAYRHAS